MVLLELVPFLLFFELELEIIDFQLVFSLHIFDFAVETVNFFVFGSFDVDHVLFLFKVTGKCGLSFCLELCFVLSLTFEVRYLVLEHVFGAFSGLSIQLSLTLEISDFVAESILDSLPLSNFIS